MAGRRKRKPTVPQLFDGWEPTAAMKARERYTRPFWSTWHKEEQQAIEDIGEAWSMRYGGSLSRALDMSNLRAGMPSPHMTPKQRLKDRWLRKWLAEMQGDRTMRRYVQVMLGAILNHDPVRDIALFREGVKIYLDLRKRSVVRKAA